MCVFLIWFLTWWKIKNVKAYLNRRWHSFKRGSCRSPLARGLSVVRCEQKPKTTVCWGMNETREERGSQQAVSTAEMRQGQRGQDPRRLPRWRCFPDACAGSVLLGNCWPGAPWNSRPAGAPCLSLVVLFLPHRLSCSNFFQVRVHDIKRETIPQAQTFSKNNSLVSLLNLGWVEKIFSKPPFRWRVAAWLGSSDIDQGGGELEHLLSIRFHRMFTYETQKGKQASPAASFYDTTLQNQRLTKWSQFA